MSEALGLGVPPAGPVRTRSAQEAPNKDESNMTVSTSMPILPGEVNELADLETANDKLLKDISTSDELPEDWPKLREVIEGKIDQHIAKFKQDENTLFDKAATPPWPMDQVEITSARSKVFTLLDSFPCSPTSAPFTIQRLAELALSPAPYYTRSLPQYLRALTRCLLVTSDASVYPPTTNSPPQTNGFMTSRARSSSVSSSSSTSSHSSNHSQHAMQQLSPIPWLRSRSPSPHEAIETSHLTLEDGPAKRQRLEPSDPLVSGRVDELDTQSTGNEMMQDPVPLTSTTTSNGTTAVEGTLSSRFAPSTEDVGVAK